MFFYAYVKTLFQLQHQFQPQTQIELRACLNLKLRLKLKLNFLSLRYEYYANTPFSARYFSGLDNQLSDLQDG